MQADRRPPVVDPPRPAVCSIRRAVVTPFVLDIEYVIHVGPAHVLAVSPDTLADFALSLDTQARSTVLWVGEKWRPGMAMADWSQAQALPPFSSTTVHLVSPLDRRIKLDRHFEARALSLGLKMGYFAGRPPPPGHFVGIEVLYVVAAELATGPQIVETRSGRDLPATKAFLSRDALLRHGQVLRCQQEIMVDWD